MNSSLNLVDVKCRGAILKSRGGVRHPRGICAGSSRLHHQVECVGNGLDLIDVFLEFAHAIDAAGC